MNHAGGRWLIGIGLIVLLSMTGWLEAAGESQYRGGPGRTGDAGSIFAPAADDASSSAVLFVVEARPLRLSYTDNTIVDLPTQCRVHALDAQTGRTLWSIETPGAIYRDFTLAASADHSGRLVYYSWDQHYYAVNARTGELVWRVKDEGPAGSPAIVVDAGIVHTGAAALSLATGREVWRRGGDVKTSLAPAVNGPMVFGPGVALHALKGEPIWNNPISAEAITAMLLSGPVVVVGDADGRLTAFAADSGRILWTLEIERHIYQPSANATHVFVAARDRNLRALDIQSGEPAWSVTTIGGFDGTPVVDGGRVFCRTREQYLFALDAASGRELWKVFMEDESPLPIDPAAGDGLVFIVGRQRVRALNAATGEAKWERAFDLPVDWAHPVLAR